MLFYIYFLGQIILTCQAQGITAYASSGALYLQEVAFSKIQFNKLLGFLAPKLLWVPMNLCIQSPFVLSWLHTSREHCSTTTVLITKCL